MSVAASRLERRKLKSIWRRSADAPPRSSNPEVRQLASGFRFKLPSIRGRLTEHPREWLMVAVSTRQPTHQPWRGLGVAELQAGHVPSKSRLRQRVLTIFICGTESTPLFQQPVNNYHCCDADERHRKGGKETGNDHHCCAADKGDGGPLSPAVNQIAARNGTPDARRPQKFLIHQIHGRHNMLQPHALGQSLVTYLPAPWVWLNIRYATCDLRGAQG